MQQKNISDLERDIIYRRNLQQARRDAEQEKKQHEIAHMQKIASSRSGVKPMTSASAANLSLQKNQMIQQRSFEKKNKMQKSSGRIHTLESIISKYEKTPWALLYVVAVFDDVADIIPLISVLTSVTTAIYINAKLWNVGDARTRIKLRILRLFIVLVDTIPILNLFPASLYVVYSAKKIEQLRAEKAEKEIKKINEKRGE